jgi:MFS family permease
MVTLMMVYATTFNELYVLRAIMGISEAFYIPAGLSLIADYHQGKTRSLAIGIHTTGIYLGQALGGFGATIASNFSWQLTFHSFGLIGMAYSVILIIFLKEKKAYQHESKVGNSFFKEFGSSFKGLAILFGNISFWVILFNFSAPSLPGWATKNWLPTLFSESLNLDMAQAGPMATITIAMASLFGVLIGGIISDKWVQKVLRGRIYTGVIGLSLTIPALILLGYGQSFLPIVAGAICFGLGFGIYDVNSMPILCQFVSPRYRATGYGIMNLAGISAGAVITNFLGKSADAGNLGKDFVLLAGVVVVAIALQLAMLHPKTINKTED